ncbi:MAG: peptidase MA family metallohydrolase [Gemmatimonas sp.]
MTAAALAFGASTMVAQASSSPIAQGDSAVRRVNVPALDARQGLRLDSGRFTVVAEQRDARMAHAMLAYALDRDTFPGLPRPRAHVLIAIAPNAHMFRAWTGPGTPEWGAAIAIPDEQRIVMQGAFGNSDAGDPIVVLRHELAHLALHEYLGGLPPRWFDEGYASVAAGEWSRTTALETSVSMAWRSLPNGHELDEGFYAGASRAQYTYALSHLVVAEMQAIDSQNGLANFFRQWRRTESYDRALRQAYGMTAEGFDTYWHKRVRRQYGALSFLANISLAFGFIGIALGPLYWSKRRRNRERLAVMRENEAAQEESTRRSALSALLAVGVPEPEAAAVADAIARHDPSTISAADEDEARLPVGGSDRSGGSLLQ